MDQRLLGRTDEVRGRFRAECPFEDSLAGAHGVIGAIILAKEIDELGKKHLGILLGAVCISKEMAPKRARRHGVSNCERCKKVMVPQERLELPTSKLQISCSTN